MHYAHDENFRKILQVAAPGTSEAAWTWYGYDYRNRQATITDMLGHITHTEYDPMGNKLWVKRAEGTAVESIVQFPLYDAMNRLKHQIDERGVDTYMDYDGAGNLRFFHDGNGQIYEHQYDALNRQTAMIFPSGLDGDNLLR